jgi:hypothetical protein
MTVNMHLKTGALFEFGYHDKKPNISQNRFEYPTFANFADIIIVRSFSSTNNEAILTSL